MSGIIGKKIGMTSIFDENGKNIPVTIVEAGPCAVTQVKTEDTDGYKALQLAYGDQSEKNVSSAMLGHFKKAKTAPKRKVIEFRDFDGDYKVGDEVKVDIFEEGEFIDIVGTSKGKGFQGVMKRHGFAGVGDRTHGQGDQERAPGSIGAASDPSRVFKGVKMAGRTGGSRVKTQNLKIVKVLTEKNMVLITGSVPGPNGSYVIVEK
ncbi:50S ribosomal protein L3 [Salibacter sp.]|jgi:large subunit ribosomal protein L3|uniref:50S ribosomal protein L3 n=1 Tax=Salibacter sp. TaxID=2010995 RepID=UPI00286FC7C5|nr:50S ribosomal protein L3 [Salibacter sp.]MDR9398967.1 50S ribosomal protein L3 [Salibacter sp.]MDR9488000.1 50S ribosomal protein L3 [Salibacter sp.]